MALSFIVGQALVIHVVFVAIKFRTSIGNAISKLISLVIRVCRSLL